jgi:hypothetical protein
VSSLATTAPLHGTIVKRDFGLLLSGTWRQRLRVVLSVIVITFSIGSFAYNGVIRGFERNEPDPWHFYTAGHMWAMGENPYAFDLFRERFVANAGPEMADLNPSAFYYPPLGSMLLSVVSHGSFETAHTLLTIIYTLLLLVSLHLFTHILSWFRPIGLTELALVTALLSTAYARAGVRMLNVSIVVCVCLLLAFILSRRRPIIGGLLLAVVSLKPNFLPPQMLYYVQRRNWRFLAACVVACALLTILPLALSGRPVVQTLLDWFDGIVRLQAGNVNDPSPFTPWSSTLAYLHPLVYRVFNAQTPLTSLISYVLIGMLALYLFVFRLRAENDWSRLSSFAGWSMFTLLCVYHRHYDIFLVFPALVYLYVHARRVKQWHWYVFLPGDALVHFTLRNPTLNDSYLWRLMLPYPLWTVMAVLVAFLWVNTRAVLAEAHKHPSRSSRMPLP